MAILTDADYTWIKEWIQTNPAAKNEFKGWGLTKSQYKGALQGVETYVVSGFSVTPSTSIKAAIEVHTGSVTNAQAKQLLNAWLAWSYSQL